MADAACLERNLNLVLQVLELQPRTVVCVNLVDEAARRGIRVDAEALSARLGVPVCACAARSGEGLDALLRALSSVSDPDRPAPRALCPRHRRAVEQAARRVARALSPLPAGFPNARWLALRLLEKDEAIASALAARLDADQFARVRSALEQVRPSIPDDLQEHSVRARYRMAERICAEAVRAEGQGYGPRQLRLDRLLTSRLTGIPAMLLLLCAVFYITLAGANVPSQWLSGALLGLEAPLAQGLSALGAPAWLTGALTPGRISGSGVGGGGDAAAHGDILSSVYPAGGRGISAARRLYIGPAFSAMRRMRQAGADNVHGPGLQRRRRNRLPHHRFAPRTGLSPC